ncbi:hypothetical protein SNOG_06178 [Parastagonospora nodorum SN15]|uniref:Uncharacterized protein n=1 Tax=Phaeosphaeria nodorum (strain SN15 / ATCC MYA-4574 / FGSC 10173) TaxID=321614 RepID=Q0UPY6_PHANO|nr:hypothetical protein SNOG_06178 [Parastagonospora nodorum SN15]EAT86009.1 hypothetical protein SNOG_06178 [Parastagonospora nodorum SN15]
MLSANFIMVTRSPTREDDEAAECLLCGRHNGCMWGSHR